MPIYLHLCLYLYNLQYLYMDIGILGLGTLQSRMRNYLSSSTKHFRHKPDKRLKQTNMLLLHTRQRGLEAKHPSSGSEQISLNPGFIDHLLHHLSQVTGALLAPVSLFYRWGSNGA